MIHFEKITEKNETEVRCLKLFKEQDGFIETVEECLEEATEYAQWKPRAVYDDHMLIGFIMYGKFLDNKNNERVWFDRFLIDKSYQNKGYGRKVIYEVLRTLRKEYNCDRIFLSVYQTNTVAMELYRKTGFKEIDELDTKGEQVMCYFF